MNPLEELRVAVIKAVDTAVKIVHALEPKLSPDECFAKAQEIVITAVERTRFDVDWSH